MIYKIEIRIEGDLISSSARLWGIPGKVSEDLNDELYLHRSDGPAIEYIDGYKSYWLLDNHYHKKEWEKLKNTLVI